MRKLIPLIFLTLSAIAQNNYPVLTDETNLLISPYDDIVIDTAYNYGDIRRYGAVPGTLSEKAIDFACLAMAQVGDDVLIPIGTFLLGAPDPTEGLDGQITLTSTHNGLTIRGYGFDSVLKRADAIDHNLSIIYMGTAFNQVQNITLDHFRIDGNRVAQSTTSPPSQRNIWIDGFNNDLVINGRRPPINISLKDIFSHGSMLSGAYISAETSQITNFTGWDNGKHGLAIGAPNDYAGPGHQALVEGIHCYDNVWYGIDLTSRDSLPVNLVDFSDVTLRHFRLENNGGGMKFAGYTTAHVSEGRISGSTNAAITTTKPVREVTIHNVETRNNGGSALKIQEPGRYNISGLSSVDDLRGLYFRYTGSEEVLISAQDITVRSPGETGMIFSGNITLSVENYWVDGEGSSGLYLVDANVERLLLRQGKLRMRDGQYGFRVQQNASLIDLQFLPTTGITTYGINLRPLETNDWLVLSEVDFRSVTGLILNEDGDAAIVTNQVLGLP